MITENQSVVEDTLHEKARMLTYEEVKTIPSFAQPVKLYEQWLALPGNIPHHSNIKASSFDPGLLPFFYILDVIPENSPDNDTGDIDFQFRLFGTGNRDHYGKEGTRKRLSNMSHEGSGAGFYTTKRAYQKKSAHFLLCKYFIGDKHVKTSSLVVMPLSDDTEIVSRMFGCAIWTTPR